MVISLTGQAWAWAGRYPKPVKLGPRTTAWRAEDIAALIASFGNQDAAGKTG